MSVSEVQVAKLALQHIGDRYDINTLSESSTEAEQVALVFDNLRDALLREHPWKFARRFVSPSALSGTAPAQWGYMFAYPADALAVEYIVNPLDRDDRTLPFDVLVNSDDVKVLVTDVQSPEFAYTKQVTVPARWDSSFVMALSWRIAAHVALPLTQDRELANMLTEKAEYWVGVAKRQDANEGISRIQSRDPDWIKKRS